MGAGVLETGVEGRGRKRGEGEESFVWRVEREIRASYNPQVRREDSPTPPPLPASTPAPTPLPPASPHHPDLV